ncbi:hypothetical protein JQC67_03745 [Aurantibacter crassamenti]|uniref:hypothetical protein n=1 Tax=Aurantibacter crassamenti TaxID=1837375 RepID=UPI00193A15CE|nr:hypothetical protein [Aurantibacter crassamenti]MBM1105246.1 hypothetical protein [Aurantibacter crassamenti]
MQPNNSPSSSDEIDLSQLLQLVKKALNGVFRGILRIFLFFKRNAIKLAALIIIGVGIGFLLNSFVEDKQQTEVIVLPNFESKDYLYDVVEEIKSKVIANDTAFFEALDIDVNLLKKFKIEIEPIEEEVEDKRLKAEEDNKYLEILQNYKENDFVIDVVKSEVLKKSIRTHRITFTHKNPKRGEEYVSKILAYINSNQHFIELQKAYSHNATLRIEQNNGLIKQIDDLVSKFSESLNLNQNSTGQSLVLLEGENGLNIPSLLMFKNRLVKENEVKQIELIEQKLPISILNLGKTHIVKKQLLNLNFVLIPLLLVGLFFLVSLIAYLNRRSLEIK